MGHYWGRLVSKLLLAALAGQAEKPRVGSALGAGFRPLKATNLKPVTNEQIDQLRDQDGLWCGLVHHPWVHQVAEHGPVIPCAARPLVEQELGHGWVGPPSPPLPHKR